MFKEFLYPLVQYFTPFNIFQYITFRAAFATITALLVTFLIAPKLIAFLRKKKLGESIRSDGPQTHHAKSGTPTMGGIMIAISTLVAVFLWQDLRQPYTWMGILVIIGFGLVGFIDDYIKVFKKNKEGLSAKSKLIGQFLVSFAVSLWIFLNQNQFTTDLYIPFVKEAVLDLSYFYIPFAMLLLVFFSNAVNMADGLDGLATGLVLFVAITYAIIAYVTGRVDWSEYLQVPYIPGAGEMTILALALAGACIGFLWYNSNPAEIFMGDTGSLMMGGTLAFMALMLKKEVLLVIVGGVLVIEAFSVMIQIGVFKLTKGKKRVFLMAPIHHHFELKGWAESKVVIRFWILGGLFAILGLSTFKII